MQDAFDIFLKLHAQEPIGDDRLLLDIEVLVVGEDRLGAGQLVELRVGEQSQRLATGPNGRARNQLVFPFAADCGELVALLANARATFPLVSAAPVWNADSSRPKLVGEFVHPWQIVASGPQTIMRITWNARQGEWLVRGDRIASLKGKDSVVSQIVSPVDGILDRIAVATGIVKDGEVVGRLLAAQDRSTRILKRITVTWSDDYGPIGRIERSASCARQGEYCEKGRFLFWVRSSFGTPVTVCMPENGIIERLIMRENGLPNGSVFCEYSTDPA